MEENTNFDKTPIKTLPLDFWDIPLFGDKPKVVLPPVADNQMRLSNNTIITFNEEQYEAIKRIRLWLKSRKTFYTLSGCAGTGKSTIIKKIIEEYRGSIIVSATTHKAKKNIQATTGIESVTIHGILGLRPDVSIDEFNPNSPIFNQTVKPSMHLYKFIIVDECSMINLDLLDLIKKTANGLNVKILFMGDSLQIPPVGEKISAVFYDDDIEVYELTIIERQKDGNPLLPIFDSIRKNISKSDLGFERKTDLNEKNEGLIYSDSKDDFKISMIEKFKSEEYQKNTDFVKVIAWRNETVMKSNYSIRLSLFGENAPLIVVGDCIMGYRSIMDKYQTYNIIENSADYKVTKVSKLYKNSYGVNGYDVQLRENLFNDQYSYVDVFIVDILEDANMHTYAETHDNLRDDAKLNKKLWNVYYKFRRENLLMIDINHHRNGQSRNSNDKIKKDISYGWAITGHKSQGSTYDHCYILERDIHANWVTKERNQIFYVAISRPKQTATILYE